MRRSIRVLLPLPPAPPDSGAALIGELFGERAVGALCHTTLATIGAGSAPSGRRPQEEGEEGEVDLEADLAAPIMLRAPSAEWQFKHLTMRPPWRHPAPLAEGAAHREIEPAQPFKVDDQVLDDQVLDEVLDKMGQHEHGMGGCLTTPQSSSTKPPRAPKRDAGACDAEAHTTKRKQPVALRRTSVVLVLHPDCDESDASAASASRCASMDFPSVSSASGSPSGAGASGLSAKLEEPLSEEE